MKGGRQTCSRPPRVTVATICTGRVWPGLAAPENETPDPEASLSRSQTYIDTVVFPVLLFHFVQKRGEAGKRLKEGSWLTSPVLQAVVERSMSRQSWPTTPSSAWLASMAARQQGSRLARQVAKCTAMRVSFTQQAREPPPSESQSPKYGANRLFHTLHVCSLDLQDVQAAFFTLAAFNLALVELGLCFVGFSVRVI